MAWLTLSISVVGVLVIPLLILTYKLVRKGTIVEAQLQHVVEDVRELVASKDKVHSEMLAQMRDDRQATDRRLRWLEEHLWKRTE